MKKRIRKFTSRFNPMQILLFGYLVIMGIGAVLLCLPCATREGLTTSVMDAIFTSVSCTCVTGLTRYDTYEHWTLFGQIVQLMQMQIGAVGFVTMAIALISMAKRRFGIRTRIVMQNSMSAPGIGNVVRMTRFTFVFVLIAELGGALLLALWFCPKYGAVGLWYALYHSISAFCNAGFSIMSVAGENSLSGMTYAFYPSLVILFLVVIGGLGFYTILDLFISRFRFKKLRLQSQLAISVSLILIVLGTVLVFICEQFGTAFDGMTVPEQLLSSLFQAITSRSAGFTTLDLEALTAPSLLIMVLLTFVGGSVGSTSGGMKTATLAVLVLNLKSTFLRRKDPEAFGRRIDDETTQIATTVLILYMGLTFAGGIAMCMIEGCDLSLALFECASAITTSGFSLGLAPIASIPGQWILIVLMIIGRVGSITMLLAFSNYRMSVNSKYPSEHIQVG